jgi:ribosome-associated protein
VVDIRVTPDCHIDAEELEWRFLPSGGPGGQHANRSNTRVELRLDLVRSRSLSDAQRSRLVEQLGPIVRVVCDQERSQARNRAIALERLTDRLSHALRPRVMRRPTRRTRAAKARRLEAKRRRATIKRERAWRPGDD